MVPKKVLIFGLGQLGTFYQEFYQSLGVTVMAPRVDVREVKHVADLVQQGVPDLIINTVAKTSIDWCAENREEAVAVNTLGADNVAAAAEASETFLVHLSSGCIQESTSPVDVKTEEDAPHPVCFYSWTKVWAENLVLERARRGSLKVLIVRPRQLLSSAASPRNALVKFLTYAKFIDVPQSCTIVEDLLRVTHELVAKDAQGVYNVVNPGLTSPLAIATLLKEYIQPDLSITPITKSELNTMTLAKRIDAVLSIEKLQSLGITLAPIERRLRDIIPLLKRNLEAASGQGVLQKTYEETRRKLALVK